MKELTVGFALCGSFCTFEKAIAAMVGLASSGIKILPIMSFTAARTDTRFGTALDFRERIQKIAGTDEIIDTIEAAEPIGPNRMCDILVVAPCTGNTLAKLCCGIVDTPVTMAVKSHLRNKRPVVLAIATNDALSAAAKNIGELLNRKYYYFVPMSQDSPADKPTSIVADFKKIAPSIEAALRQTQLQPVLEAPNAE
ncbi:MAG: dipicolinate synthase subunit B [Oscillospiraceae bacterium]